MRLARFAAHAPIDGAPRQTHMVSTACALSGQHLPCLSDFSIAQRHLRAGRRACTNDVREQEIDDLGLVIDCPIQSIALLDRLGAVLRYPPPVTPCNAKTRVSHTLYLPLSLFLSRSRRVWSRFMQVGGLAMQSQIVELESSHRLPPEKRTSIEDSLLSTPDSLRWWPVFLAAISWSMLRDLCLTDIHVRMIVCSRVEHLDRCASLNNYLRRHWSQRKANLAIDEYPDWYNCVIARRRCWTVPKQRGRDLGHVTDAHLCS